MLAFLCLYQALPLFELLVLLVPLPRHLIACTTDFTMCDYSLTDNPAESDMPTEAEPWQPVDLSEVEEKMGKLSTKEGSFTTSKESASTPHEKSTKESASTTPLDSTSHEKVYIY